jgi:class 3 adenylate cyclase
MTTVEHRPRASEVRTFLIADIRGYTRYTHEHGDDAGSELAAQFARIVREAMPAWDGELLELRGDEALCVFVSARRALGAAVDLQGRFRRGSAGGAPLPQGVGIGLDAGEALPTDGGYRGGALNLAARLCSRAQPGEILASEQVVHLARRIEGVRFGSPHTMRFKGIEDQVRVVRVMPDQDLPPPPRATAARRPAPWLPLAGVVLIATAIVAIAVVTLSRRSGSAAEAAAPFTATVGPARPLGDHRTVVAAGPAGTYIVQQQGATGGTITRIQPGKTTPDPIRPLGVIPLGVNVGAEGAWVVAVASFRSTSALLIHVPVYGSTTQVSIPGRAGCMSIAIVSCNPTQGSGSIWVAAGSRIYRYTPGRKRLDVVKAGARVFDITYGSGALWALAGSELVRIDAITGAMTRLHLEPPTGQPLQPEYVIAAGGDVWISAFSSDTTQNRLIHVETYQPTLKVAASFRFPGLGSINSGGSASLWVASTLGWHRLTRLDVRSGQHTGPTIALPDTATWIAPSGSEVWLGTYRSSDSTRRLLDVHLNAKP